MTELMDIAESYLAHLEDGINQLSIAERMGKLSIMNSLKLNELVNRREWVKHKIAKSMKDNSIENIKDIN